MARIEFNRVGLSIPIYNASGRSLKTHLKQVTTGGVLGMGDRGHMVVQALQDVTFTFSDGDRVGLVGHNGSGKSSLLRIVAGVYAPTSGQALIEGDVASLIDVSLGIDSEATGRENIFTRGALLGVSRAAMQARIDEIIAFSELGDYIEAPVRTYSAGMHLRLAFSVSTIIRPEILLMDEWLSVGDERFRQKAEKRMEELVNTTRILVLASHSRDLILKTCTRALWLEQGRVRMDADPATVCDAYLGPKP